MTYWCSLCHHHTDVAACRTLMTMWERAKNKGNFRQHQRQLYLDVTLVSFLLVLSIERMLSVSVCIKRVVWQKRERELWQTGLDRREGGTRNSWMISANFLPGPFLFWRNLPLRFRFAWLRTKYNTVNEADNKAKGNVYKIIIIIFEKKKWLDERRRNKRAADERERERERESVKWKVRHIAPRPNE